MPALVLLNPRARQGKAGQLWSTMEAEVSRRLQLTVALIDEGEQAVMQAWRAGTRFFIAAGGDGTVHSLINALLESGADLSHCLLGAVGLGSSNDFHKPFGERVADIPVRIDARRAEPRDIAIAAFARNDRSTCRRAFLISSSMGACAKANALFDRGGLLQRSVRHLSPNAAVLLAGCLAIAAHKNISARMRIDDGDDRPTVISNLSVMKTPYLGGGLSYDVPLAPADGFLAVNLCEDMARLELVSAMLGLGRGKFTGRPKTSQWRVRKAHVETSRATLLELDGELYLTDDVEFSLLPSSIRLCA